MLGSYNIDSDEEEEEEEEAPTNVPKSASTHIHELEKLKERTGELLDSSWKEQRNRHLLMKMLELEEPTVTAKMVDFLLQDGVCDILLSIITQLGTGQPRPSPSDVKTEALKLSYRAVMLLTADEPTEALMSFLSKRAGLLARGIFEIYHDDSAASFYHFYRILECLLRCFPGDVYESICSDGQITGRMRRMVRYIGYAPVGESIAMLIALTPVSRMSQLYQLSSKNRWIFFEQLSMTNFMLSLVEIIVFPEEFCYNSGYINSEQHSACATFVLQELVEKLSVEETGELLLQPFGYTSQLLENLMDTALSGSVISIRRSSTKLLCFLLRRIAESDILYMVSAGNGAAPAPAYVPNRLFPLRDRIINQIRVRITSFMDALEVSDDDGRIVSGGNSDSNEKNNGDNGNNESKDNIDDNNMNNDSKIAEEGQESDGVSNFNSETSSGPVKYSSYTVKKPFTVLKSVFFELITLMVESDNLVADLISVDLWIQLIKWTLKYAHNSIFHAIFFRLIYSVLRQEQEITQRNLFIGADFVSFLIESFSPFPATPADLPGKKAKESDVSRYVARGLIMNCANAIRLQVNSQPPSAFLRSHLENDESWSKFLIDLKVATAVQLNYAFCLKVPEHAKAGQAKDTVPHYISPEDLNLGSDAGSRFAKNLGFFDESGWDESNEADRLITDSSSSGGVISNNNKYSIDKYSDSNSNLEDNYLEKKSEKSKKKKSKKKRGSGPFPEEHDKSEEYSYHNGTDSSENNHSNNSSAESHPAEENGKDTHNNGNGSGIVNGIISSGRRPSFEMDMKSSVLGSLGLGLEIPNTLISDPDALTQSSHTSSPNKLGGSVSGNVICVTEICVDEIEKSEKIEKIEIDKIEHVTNELNSLSLSHVISSLPAPPSPSPSSPLPLSPLSPDEK